MRRENWRNNSIGERNCDNVVVWVHGTTGSSRLIERQRNDSVSISVVRNRRTSSFCNGMCACARSNCRCLCLCRWHNRISIEKHQTTRLISTRDGDAFDHVADLSSPTTPTAYTATLVQAKQALWCSRTDGANSYSISQQVENRVVVVDAWSWHKFIQKLKLFSISLEMFILTKRKIHWIVSRR